MSENIRLPHTSPADPIASAADRVAGLVRDAAVEPVFQPIVCLHDGGVIGYEALSRPRPGTGFAHAGELFDAAAAGGLLWELETLTRGVTLAAAADWPDQRLVFLNCTPLVFADRRFADAVDAAVRGVPGLSPERVVLEITELSAEQHVHGLAEQVDRLRAAGFQIAIDDVGAGTSGMSRIMRLRPHWLKLDREFVAGIDADAFKQNLVRFFVHFARLSGVKVVAEGIEKREELATIIGLGVVYGQGFYTGRPAARPGSPDPAVASWIGGCWSEVERTLDTDPHFAPLHRLCKPALAVQGGVPIGRAASQLADDPSRLGAAVFDGKRYVGWCDRDRVARAARERQRNGTKATSRPVGSLAVPGVCALSPEATVQEGLRAVCARDERDLAAPLVVADRGVLVGVVPLRDLLSVAAADRTSPRAWSAPLTGLPGRVCADRHVSDLIERARRSARPGERGWAVNDGEDAAIVDIRQMTDFNGAYGYELGDALIRRLGSLLRERVVAGDDRVFLAHPGEDRFLVVGPSVVLSPRLMTVARASEDGSEWLSGVDPSRPGSGLRILIVPAVASRIAHPRDLYRIEQQLRRSGRAQEQTAGAGRAVVLVDRRSERAPMRLSA